MWDKLLEIGLNDLEARLYLELLSIGPQLVSIISKRLNVPRSTVYSILKVLERKGFVSYRVIDNAKFYSANDPNCLIGYLDRQCRTFDYYRSQMLSLIPKFRSLMHTYEFKKPVVSYFEGLAGVKHFMNSFLKTGMDFNAYLSMNSLFSPDLKDFFYDFKDVCLSKNCPVRIISLDTEDARSFFDFGYSKNEAFDVLFVEGENYSEIFQNDMILCDNKVAILHLESGNEYGVVIENEEVYKMQKKIFEMAWRGLASF